MAFQFQKKPLQSSVRESHETVEVYIGLDFGTTFTKVSYQIGDKEGTTKYSLPFASDGCESDYCLPSVLGYDPLRGCLAFTKDPEDCGFEVIRYFKYSMIQKNVPRSRAFSGHELNNDPQRLCSAFYVAHVLKLATEFISEYLALAERGCGIRWYVNMGVPVSDFAAKPKPVYDEVLNVAWKLVEQGLLADEMELGRVDQLYNQWIDHSTWSNRLNTVPELYAEIIMFLQDRTVDSGFYSVVDIGGGTVDLAVFFKRIDAYTHRVEISCVAQDVCPLGYEMYKHVVGEVAAKKMCQKSYGELVDKAYHNYRPEMQKAKNRRNEIVHFYMGGARNVPFYRSCIEGMWPVHERAWSCYPGAVVQDIVRYMRNKAYLEVDDNSRVVISQMLAQPFEKIPELTGQPWNFDKAPRYKNAPTAEDVMLGIYGD